MIDILEPIDIDLRFKRTFEKVQLDIMTQIYLEFSTDRIHFNIPLVKYTQFYQLLQNLLFMVNKVKKFK